jgi:hypothetical protein
MKPQKYTVYAEFGYDCYLLSDENTERKYIGTEKVVLASDFEHLECLAEAMSADCERLEKRIKGLEKTLFAISVAAAIREDFELKDVCDRALGGGK